MCKEIYVRALTIRVTLTTSCIRFFPKFNDCISCPQSNRSYLSTTHCSLMDKLLFHRRERSHPCASHVMSCLPKNTFGFFVWFYWREQHFTVGYCRFYLRRYLWIVYIKFSKRTEHFWKRKIFWITLDLFVLNSLLSYFMDTIFSMHIFLAFIVMIKCFTLI